MANAYYDDLEISSVIRALTKIRLLLLLLLEKAQPL